MDRFRIDVFDTDGRCVALVECTATGWQAAAARAASWLPPGAGFSVSAAGRPGLDVPLSPPVGCGPRLEACRA